MSLLRVFEMHCSIDTCSLGEKQTVVLRDIIMPPDRVALAEREESPSSILGEACKERKSTLLFLALFVKQKRPVGQGVENRVLF